VLLKYPKNEPVIVIPNMSSYEPEVRKAFEIQDLFT
jgi:hypothetical protein